MAVTAPVRMRKKKLEGLQKDPQKAAEAAALVYVHDSDPGILRKGRAPHFRYQLNGQAIRDAQVLARIRKLAIPPAWTSVWICPLENGHLQATGLDVRGRKQYRYHPVWTALRNHTKFHHLEAFGQALPAMRQQLEADLKRPGLPREKVLAAVVMIMLETGIRIGNAAYEKLNGSFGLTTLKDQHVREGQKGLRFCFVGKKGIRHDVGLESRKLSRIVLQCRDIPGKELFQYYDEAGERHSIDSGMVNQYIRTISGGPFSAKDFRTWSGTLHCLNHFRSIGPCTGEAETKRRVLEALDLVAERLGNTRTVCRKYYVLPQLIDLFCEGKLSERCGEPESGNASGLKPEEHLLLEILAACPKSVALV